MLRTKSGPEREVYSCTDDSDSVVQGERGGDWYSDLSVKSLNRALSCINCRYLLQQSPEFRCSTLRRAVLQVED